MLLYFQYVPTNQDRYGERYLSVVLLYFQYVPNNQDRYGECYLSVVLLHFQYVPTNQDRYGERYLSVMLLHFFICLKIVWPSEIYLLSLEINKCKTKNNIIFCYLPYTPLLGYK